MEILIDRDRHGFPHSVTWEEPHPVIFDHPSNDGTKTTIVGLLTHHNSHPEAREVGGWHVVNQLDGEPHPMTRWERLVRAVNALELDHPLRALDLK